MNRSQKEVTLSLLATIVHILTVLAFISLQYEVIHSHWPIVVLFLAEMIVSFLRSGAVFKRIFHVVGRFPVHGWWKACRGPLYHPLELDEDNEDDDMRRNYNNRMGNLRLPSNFRAISARFIANNAVTRRQDPDYWAHVARDQIVKGLRRKADEASTWEMRGFYDHIASYEHKIPLYQAWDRALDGERRAARLVRNPTVYGIRR